MGGVRSRGIQNIGLEACVGIEDDCSYKMEEQETRKKLTMRPAAMFTTEDDCNYKLSIVYIFIFGMWQLTGNLLVNLNFDEKVLFCWFLSRGDASLAEIRP